MILPRAYRETHQTSDHKEVVDPKPASYAPFCYDLENSQQNSGDKRRPSSHIDKRSPHHGCGSTATEASAGTRQELATSNIPSHWTSHLLSKKPSPPLPGFVELLM